MKIGIVSTSFIVEHVINEIKSLKDIFFVALYSRRYEKGLIFKEKYNIKKLYLDYEEMLEDEEIDTIYIASPNSLHFIQAKKALEHHKNVIIEKPFATNLKQTEELISLAIKNKLYLFEAITLIHSKNYQLLKEKIKEIGRIKEINSIYCQRSSRLDLLLSGKEPNIFSLKYSGGALMDLNVYNLHFINGLLKNYLDIKYDAYKYTNGIDLGGTINIEYKDAHVKLIAYKDRNDGNKVQIIGEDGYILMDDNINNKKAFDLYKNNQKHHYDIENNYRFINEFECFKEIIQNNDYSKMLELLNNTKEVMELLDKARKSANIIFEDD